MKILKIFGVVVGIHLFALILIFANPGCSSSSKPTPAPVDTLARGDPSPPTVSVPLGTSPMTVSPGFNPDAPATSSSGGSRYIPTRPNTPAATTLVAPPVADVTPAATYTVRAGDSLWSIANRNHLKPADLAAANSMNIGVVLQPGQKLLIPAKAPGAAVPASPSSPVNGAGRTAASSSSGGVRHSVKPGETLSAIAQQYGVTVRELGTVNNITDPQKLRAGMILVIPGWQPAGAGAKGSKSGKAGDAARPASTPPVEAKPLFNILDPGASRPAASSEPPVIRVEDSPMTPAPKGK